MEYFKHYVSNTLAASGNQFFFSAEKPQTGRAFYRISHGGSYGYSLLFSNVLDSTFADGSKGHKNLVCRSWQIHGARIGRLKKGGIPEHFTDPQIAAEINGADLEFREIFFDGKKEKSVAPGEFFTSDPVDLTFDAEDYLCLETTVSGPQIPYHEESLLPVFVREEEGWRYRRQVPAVGMVGCNRAATMRIGYLGDSITQGSGVKYNSYAHWNAVLSDLMGGEYAYWNLGIGYGRADDIASDGAWLYKAKQNDLVFLCAGVNDIQRGFSAEQTVRNLKTAVTALQKEGVRVILQTVPPFNYNPERTEIWEEINRRIQTELADSVELVFDVVPVLGEEDKPQNAKFGGHPNEEGCLRWGTELSRAVAGKILPEAKKNPDPSV